MSENGFFNEQVTYSKGEALDLLAVLDGAVNYLLTLDGLHPQAFALSEQAAILTGKLTA